MKRSILLVDDDPSVRNAIGRVLERAGYEVTAIGDGTEVILRFDENTFDVVLLDLNLAQERGWDVFERLTTRWPVVPIIIITGVTGQFKTARAAGVGALLEKPVEVPVLLKTIEELIAEPQETRLGRLCGHRHDTRYFPAHQMSNSQSRMKVRHL